MKMTASLLQGYDWYKQCPQSYKKAAFQQIVGMLNKEPFTNKAVERGQAYEDSIDVNVPPKGLEFIQGSMIQPWMQAYHLEAKTGIYTFRGRLDYYKKNPAHWPMELVTENKTMQKWFDEKAKLIIDLKTTSKFNKSSYVSKRQHIIYGLAENCPNFCYAVGVFDDAESLIPTRIELIPFIMNLKEEEKILMDSVNEFVDWMVNENLWNTFINVYNTK